MRRLATLAVLLSLPGLIGATPIIHGRLSTPPATKPLVAPAKPLPVSPRTSPLPPAPALLASDAGACRMTCASARYVCVAGDAGDECDSSWSRCVSACNSPNLDFGISTAP